MDKIPAADKRSKQDVLEQLKQRAASYTPEWRFDESNPDAGTALALVFAEMHYKTLQQYNKMAYKARNEFFNCLHASMKAAVPAVGFVSFGLVNDTAEGVELAAGIGLTTDAVGEDGERIPIETTDDVYVSPTEICCIYESWDKLDYIGEIYNQEELHFPFQMFHFQGNNLQSHKFYMSHSHVLSLKHAGIVGISIYGRNKEVYSEEVLKVLSDRTKVRFSYSCENGFCQFESQSVRGNRLCLEKALSQPAVSAVVLGEQEECWIQCEIIDFGALDKAVPNFTIEDLYISSRIQFLAPDCVNANGVDSSIESFFPFGEQFGIYNEVYIGAEEALSKKGALVHLTFRLNFAKIPLDYSVFQNEVDWKLVMPKGAIKTEKEYDISIEEVVWEYFNGNGWVRLFQGKEYGDIFGISKGIGEREMVMTFLCPKDSMRGLVGGVESYYIRARILKVNHAYKTTGQFVSPFMEETRIRYEYLGEGENPQWFYVRNNRMETLYRAADCLNKMERFCPVKQAGDKVPTVYIGTKQAFLDGPLRILWVVEHSGYERKPMLAWEYYSEGCWRELNPADETEHFRKTGLVTFTGWEDSSKGKLFGEELYWIRIRDLENGYGENMSRKKPFISGFYMNGVKVHAVRSDYEEFFTLNEYIENFLCAFMHPNIYACEVWVKEPDLSGLQESVWVKWKRVEGLTGSSPEDKDYVLDSNQGILRFGNNKHGKIPAVGVPDGIHVKYSVGGGINSNLSAGKITGLDLAAGYINRVSNPLDLSGGYNKETVSEAMKRSAGEIKHQFRAVTVGDYEKLALEVSGNLQKVKCFSGYNEEAKREFGHVTLVLLQKDYLSGNSHFYDLKENVYGYLEDKINPSLIKNNRFHIVEPLFVTLQISVEAAAANYNQLFDSKKQILQQLEQYIDCVNGNFSHRGWEIGSIPKYNQIFNILHDSKGSYQVLALSITCFIEKNNTITEVDLEVISRHPFILPLNGKHRVKLIQAGVFAAVQR